MNTEILSQINDIERLINAECEKHNITALDPCLLKGIPDASICHYRAETVIMSAASSETAYSNPPHMNMAYYTLQLAAVYCHYAKEVVGKKPQQAIFLLSAAYYQFGCYTQINESIRSNQLKGQWGSKKALNKRHESNRAIKDRVIEYYKANKSRYQSKDQAAESIREELNIYRGFRTVRQWLYKQ